MIQPTITMEFQNVVISVNLFRDGKGVLFNVLYGGESNSIWLSLEELRDLYQGINTFLLNLEHPK